MPAGLQTRIAAAAKLREVLAGAVFAPVTAADMADSRDRALANRLATTALRRHGHISHILSEVLQKGLPRRSGSFEAALRLAVAELLFMPGQAAHSAIYLAVEAIKRDKKAAHLARLMNGVLRQVQRQTGRFADLPADMLFPHWLAARWSRQYGEEAVTRFGQALIAGAPLDLTLRDAARDVLAALDAVPVYGDTIRVMERDAAVSDLPGFAEGRWWVQDMSAAVPARLMALPAGRRVLDMCAAPGGKTAQLLKTGYEVTALDADETRLDRVADNLRRLGYTARLIAADAAHYRPETLFDGVLLDAPCTASGTFRRHPEVLLRADARGIAGRVKLQRELLANAVRCLKPGGVLIYCTCSLEPEEGESQADWLTAHAPDMAVFPIAPEAMGALAPALDGAGRLRLHPGLAAPGGADGAMDGFFVARFRRAAG